MATHVPLITMANIKSSPINYSVAIKKLATRQRVRAAPAMAVAERLNGVQVNLEELWAEHLDTEFVAKSADLAVDTMVPDSYVCVSTKAINNTQVGTPTVCLTYHGDSCCHALTVMYHFNSSNLTYLTLQTWFLQESCADDDRRQGQGRA
jgi:hypothetical protein